MRVIGEVPHPECKISVFLWNQKYLIKFEQGPLEQTFKVSELDFGSHDELKSKITPDFINRALSRFALMRDDLIALT